MPITLDNLTAKKQNIVKWLIATLIQYTSHGNRFILSDIVLKGLVKWVDKEGHDHNILRDIGFDKYIESEIDNLTYLSYILEDGIPINYVLLPHRHKAVELIFLLDVFIKSRELLRSDLPLIDTDFSVCKLKHEDIKIVSCAIQCRDKLSSLITNRTKVIKYATFFPRGLYS